MENNNQTKKSKYLEVPEGQPFICDGHIYIIRKVTDSTLRGNLENGQDIIKVALID